MGLSGDGFCRDTPCVCRTAYSGTLSLKCGNANGTEQQAVFSEEVSKLRSEYVNAGEQADNWMRVSTDGA
jgi:hypothetical protein